MIRNATKLDIPRLVEMMRHYADESPTQAQNNLEQNNATYVQDLFFSLIVGKGFILVDENLNGFIAAIKIKNIWRPTVYELHELAWWVEPEKRNTTLGGRLWTKFNLIANKMLENKEIHLIYCTKMATSPVLNYEKRGYQYLETRYYKDELCQHQ